MKPPKEYAEAVSLSADLSKVIEVYVSKTGDRMTAERVAIASYAMAEVMGAVLAAAWQDRKTIKKALRSLEPVTLAQADVMIKILHDMRKPKQ